mmetsp:Transcript_66092/g.158093  ORF Transcript_66092/g.158093 Transcript_66092/m.158093 type:complete len:736 (+) Transcript_66092:149-2356(+)
MLRLPIDQRHDEAWAALGADQKSAPDAMPMVAEVCRSSEGGNSSTNEGTSPSEVGALDGVKLSVKNTFINVSGAESESLETRNAQSCVARLSEPNPRLFPSKVSQGNMGMPPFGGVRYGEMTPESTAAPEDAHEQQNSQSAFDEESDDDSKKIATLSLNIPPRQTRKSSLGGSTPLAVCPPVKEESSVTTIDEEGSPLLEGSPSRRPLGTALPVVPTQVKNTFLHFKPEDSFTPKGSQTCTARIDAPLPGNFLGTQEEEEELIARGQMSKKSNSSAPARVEHDAGQMVPQLSSRAGSKSSVDDRLSLELSRCVSPGATPMMRTSSEASGFEGQRSSDLLAQAAARAMAAADESNRFPDLSRCLSPGATPMGRTGSLTIDTKQSFIAGRDSWELESLAEERSASHQTTTSHTTQQENMAPEVSSPTRNQAPWLDSTAEEISPKMPPPAYKAPVFKKEMQDAPPPPPPTEAPVMEANVMTEAAGRPVLMEAFSRMDGSPGPSPTARGRLRNPLPPAPYVQEHLATAPPNIDTGCGSPMGAMAYAPPAIALSTTPMSQPSSPGRRPPAPVSPTRGHPQGMNYMAAPGSPTCLSTGPVMHSPTHGGGAPAPAFAPAAGAPPASSLPSVGSQHHGYIGKDGQPTCRPCAWFQKDGNCLNGRTCGFCHLCPPGELKQRKKQKIARFRKMEAAGLGGRGAANAGPSSPSRQQAAPLAANANARGPHASSRQVFLLSTALTQQ